MGKLNAPKQNIWMVALVCAIVSIVLFALPYIGTPIFFAYQGMVSYILMAVAYVLLMLGTKLKGM